MKQGVSKTKWMAAIAINLIVGGIMLWTIRHPENWMIGMPITIVMASLGALIALKNSSTLLAAGFIPAVVWSMVAIFFAQTNWEKVYSIGTSACLFMACFFFATCLLAAAEGFGRTVVEPSKYDRHG